MPISMDVFAADGFSTRELSDAIRIIPNRWGRIGQLGLFTPRAIRTSSFQIERLNGQLNLVSSSPRGTPAPGAKRGKRDLKSFKTDRFARQSRITPEDISGIRAFGETSELMQVQDEVLDRQTQLRAEMDITREYLRVGALRGQVVDPSDDMIVDLFDVFDISQKEVDFDFDTEGVSTRTKVAAIRRHIELNLLGDVMTGIHALCSTDFMDKLMTDPEVERDLDRRSNTVEYTEDGKKLIRFEGVTFEEYLASAQVIDEQGEAHTRDFIPTGDARFFPVGTVSTFRDVNSPMDHMDYVNTPGEPFYSQVIRDNSGRWADVEAEMNTVPICMRPAVLVRGHSSA